MTPFMTQLVDFINTQDYNIFSVAQMERDSEPETYEFLKTNPCQDCYSCAKAYTMTAIGILCDRGLLTPEDKVCDVLKKYIPEKGMDERWYDITVHMALTHTAGLAGGILDIDVNNAMDFGRDHLAYMLTTPLLYTPGTDERYSDGAYYLLARIAEEITGMGMDDFLWENLLFPLEVREAAFSHCPLGHTVGASGLYIRSGDLVKLGRLYLDGGIYKGKRLLSEEWTRIAPGRGYCFDKDENSSMYYKGGMNGQKLFVFPDLDRAVAVQGYGADTGAIGEFIKTIKL